MGKKDKKSKKFFDEDEDDIYMENTGEEFGSPAAGTPEPESNEKEGTPEVEGSKEAEEGNLEDEFATGGLLGALKRTRKRKDDKKEQEEAEKAAAAAAAAAPVVQVKSKKEKEREKKEREKAKKKAQAERKMTAPAPVEKKKAATTAAGDEKEVEKPAAKAPAKKKSGKSAIAAALQKQIAARKAAEDAQRAAEEEELQRIEEEERRLAEEERLKEEQRLKKKEREKQKKEELKAAGKYLTKKQKEQLALQEKRRQDLLSSGVKVEGLLGGEVQKPKKVVYGKKKGGKRQQSEEPEEVVEKKEEEEKVEIATPVETPEPVEAAVKPVETVESKDDEEDALIDDWEAALDSDGEVKDDWENLLDEEKKAEKKEEEKKKEEIKEVEKKETKKEEKTNGKAKESTTSAATPEPGSLDHETIQRAAAKIGKRQAQINEKREERLSKAMASASSANLRSPICCILGHVDTGKTKLLDKVRQTNVQEGEAGGITQQIGATYFPIDAIEQKTQVMKQFVDIQYNVPGLLVIDTPGHESFTNLRSRGSSLCNIAILVVDIMHGLEQQTLESIRLLRDRKTPFVVALNKIDRLYDWESTPNNSFRDSYAKQKLSVQSEFQDRLEKTKVAFAEQGLNSELYFQNDNLARTVSLVPTSAITGEGVPDLLYLLLELTQSRMSKQLMYLSQLEATVLEVKVIEGLGTTIDVVLSNGILREGDRIVLCGQNGPIATNVRALLTPQPLRELRIKSAYVHNKEVKAALGVKIAANDLDMAVAGSRLLLVGPDDDEDELMDDVMDDLTGLLDSVDKSGRGVSVQASTLGSLEALLDFLKDMKIPVMSIAIGPVFKRDVMRATTMLEKAKEYAVMLCFDVKIDKEAEQYAEEQGVRIFSADIIYHLFDAFTAYQQKLLEQRKKDHAHDAIYPCILKTIQVINKRNPMIIGVDVVEGSVRIGTPIAVVKTDETTHEKHIINLGTVVSLEVNHKSTDIVKKGQTNAGVAVRLESPSGQQPTWGRHMDESDPLYSQISRKSIDTLKDPAFRNDVARDDWLLIKSLKPLFDIK